ARLAMMLGVIVDHSLGEFLDCRVLPGLVSGGGWVLTLLGGGQDLEGFGPGLLRGENPVLAERHAAKCAADPVLDQVGALAAGQDADAEARQFAVEDDVVFVARLS